MSAEGKDDKLTTIILEHRFSGQPFDLERYNQSQTDNESCLNLHGVRHVVSYLTPDRLRMICVFEVPDVEAVRRTARQLGYGYDQLWPATIIR